MHFLSVDPLGMPSLMHATGWTLAHSLWQGLIAALVALAILGLTRKSSSLLRYNLLLILFISFVITVVVTFSVQQSIQPERDAQAVSADVSLQKSLPGTGISLRIADQTKSYLFAFETFFNAHQALIVTVWFLFFCMHTLKLAFNLGYIYRIRNFKTLNPPDEWLQRCIELKGNLGIKEQVCLKQSSIVKAPLVVGFLKPLILLPAGLLTSLPYNQVESILLHELAHIRRKDYLVNLVQNFVEAIFFFNPAILWISFLIKKERESCCDEIAVRHLHSKSHYIQALVSFQEYSLSASGYALRFPGRKNFLLQRVKRIMNNENKKLSSMEKTILFCGTFIIAAFSIFSFGEGQARNEIPKSVQRSSTEVSDTIPKKKRQNTGRITTQKERTHTRITTEDSGGKKSVVVESNNGKGKNIKARLLDNQITHLAINDRKVAREDFSKYEEEVRSLIKEQHLHTDEKQLMDLENKLKALAERQRMRELSLQDKRESEAGKEKMKQLMLEERKARQQKVQQSKAADRLKRQLEQLERQEKQALMDLKEDRHPRKEDPNHQVKDILGFLEKNNIIKGKEGTAFKLTDNELLVNGVKQPDELHLQLKQKYIYNAGDFYTFSCSGGTTDITVHRVD